MQPVVQWNDLRCPLCIKEGPWIVSKHRMAAKWRQKGAIGNVPSYMVAEP